MKKILLIISAMFSVLAVYGQTGIGTKTVDPSALMELKSTNKGFLPPRVQLLSGTDITTIPAPATGLTVYHTGIAGMPAGLYVNLGTSASATWVNTSGSNWGLTGNAGTLPANNFIGTTDLADFITRTNNTERMRITAAGNVGIGTNAPGTTLDVNGAITNRETAIAVAGNAVTVPNNISQVMLTGVASANIAVTAPAAPNSGQRLIIYNNTDGGFPALLNNIPVPAAQAMEFVYSNGNWRGTNGGATAITPNTFWSNNGNTGTNASTNFIGTTDNVDFITRTNNTEKLRVTGAGNLGIGTNAPGTSLDVNGAITNRETPIAITAGNAAIIPFNVSQVQLTGAPTANVVVVGPAAPNAGQRLIIYNNTNNTNGNFTALLNSIPIPMGQAMEFAYSNGNWRGTNGGAVAGNLTWGINGNGGTLPATNFIGTTDNVDFVTKTNNAEKMRITTAGNVGIGTTAPLGTVHIVNSNLGGNGVGGSTVNTALRLENSNNGQSVVQHMLAKDASGAVKQLYMGINPSVNGNGNGVFSFSRGATSDLIIDLANGNVGIGNNIPTANLEIGSATGPVNPTLRLHSSGSVYGSGAILDFNDVNNTNGTRIRHQTGANGTTQLKGLYFNSLINGTESTNPILMIDQVGNQVGIGTAAPGTTLDVNGAITNRETAIAVAANAATIPANTSQVQLTGAATANIAVTAPSAPNAGQRLIIYNNTTNGFPAVLNSIPVPMGQAMEFAFSGGNWRGTNGGAVAGNLTWGINGNGGTLPATNFIGTTNSVDFVTRTNNTEKMRVTAAGNVGIGTTTPNSILDLGTTVGASITDVLGKKLALYNNAAGNDFYGLGISSGFLQFHASATPAKAPGMVLGSSGNVGIGTTAPAQVLSVVDGVNTNQLNGMASFMANNLTYGVGIGYAGIQAIGSNPNNNLFLNAKGAAAVVMQTAPGVSGYVGIGTQTPNAPLQFGNGGNRTIVLYEQANNDHQVISLGFFSNAVRYQSNATTTDHIFFAGTSATTSNELMRITGTGRVGIGTVAPSQALHVVGDAYKTGGTSSWLIPSDRRVKKDIRPYTDGLQQILKINPVFFKYNGKGGIPASTSDQVGVIAQEIQKVAPYTVKETDIKVDESGKGLLQLQKADAIMYMLVNGMKEQQDMIKAQQAAIEKLQAELKMLKAMTTKKETKKTTAEKLAKR